MRKLLVATALLFVTSCGGNPPDHSMQEVKDALEETGMAVAECEEQAAGMIGARAGCAFEVGPETVEVYTYNLDIGSGQDAFQRIQEEGVAGSRAFTTGNVAVLLLDEHPRADGIRDALQRLGGS